VNCRIFKGVEIDGTCDTWYKEKKGMTLQKERKMKKIARILGGALILLVIIVALVSCDDDLLLPGGENGGLGAELIGALFQSIGDLQITPPDMENPEPPVAPDPDDLGPDALIQSIEDAIDLIKDDLDIGKGKEGLPPLEGEDLVGLKDAFDKLLSERKGKITAPGVSRFWFGVYGGAPPAPPKPLPKADGVTIRFDSPEGFFMDVMDKDGFFISIILDSEFEITAVEDGKPDITGSYEISLKGARMEDNDGIQPIVPIVIESTLKKIGDDEPKDLVADDVLFDEDGNFKWNKVAGEGDPDFEPHQRILTVLMSAFTLPQLEKEATMWFYFDVEIEGHNDGKFVAGITAENADGDTYNSAIWQKNDGTPHLIVWSDDEEYSDFIVIDKVAYSLPIT